MNWSGQWPAPYWFAVGLGTLLAYGLLVPGLKHLVCVLPFAIFLVYITWFFEIGIYHSWVKFLMVRNHRLHYLGYWGENLPTLILMIGFVVSLLYSRGTDNSLRTVFGVALFLDMFVVLFILADSVCSIHLPTDGTFGFGFDHDVFGFRIGIYYLMTVTLSVLLLKLLVKTKVSAPSQDEHEP